MEADKDGDGKLSFEEFAQMVANTVSYLSSHAVPGKADHTISTGHRETNDARGSILNTAWDQKPLSIPFTVPYPTLAHVFLP